MGERGARDKIVDSAVELFNAQGTRPVSTNHIAEAAGISPGNLYYHFANKEAIVRAIYERAIGEYDAFLHEAVAARPDPAATLGLLDGIFAHQWRYRFLQREFPALVRQDEKLCERYREMQERRLAFYRLLAGHWIEAGHMRPVPPNELEDLVMAIWLIGDTWLSYLEAMGRGADETEVRRGARLIHTILRPYLTASATRALEEGS